MTTYITALVIITIYIYGIKRAVQYIDKIEREALKELRE
jgi:hypothetical protein